MANANVDTFMNRAGTDNGHGNNLPIELVEIPEPEILSLTSLPGAGEVELDIRVAATAAGNYVQDGCACGPVGFRIVQQSVPMGAKPDPGAPWAESTPVGGGSQLLATPGDTVPVESPCPEGNDLYLATRLTFDSGFETDVVSPPTRVRCSQCVGIDADGDGFCKEAGNGVAADCDDGDPTVHPNAEQICDGLNNDCGHPTWPALAGTNEVDLDGDGLSECNGDCDDTNPTIGVAAAEVCDGVNNDCHDPQWPALPASEADVDGDGWSVCGGDCDDSKSSVFPGAPELACDGVNNDCGHPEWPQLPAEEIDNDRDGSSICGGDCNDGDPGLRPGAMEVCNGIDDDCDGAIDEGADGVDSDADGIPNGCDNCTVSHNPGQFDADGDGLGDACDTLTLNESATEEYVDGIGTSYIFVKLDRYLEQELSENFKPLVTGSATLDAVIQANGIHAIEVAFPRVPRNPRLARAKTYHGLDRVYKFYFPPGADVLQLVAEIEQLPEVEYAHPARRGTVSLSPDSDPYYSDGSQWFYNDAVNDKDVDGPEAWDISTGDNVVIAVIDSGVQADHRDIVGKFVTGRDFVDEPNDNDPQDEHGHGTWVSSILAANTDSGAGIAGSCWNCRIMPIRVADNMAHIGDQDFVDGITWAIEEEDVSIINYSIREDDPTLSVPTIAAAIATASDCGLIQVAAAGNLDSGLMDYPAKYPETIAVGGTNKNDWRWESGESGCAATNGSNYGPQLDVVAPAVDIWGAWGDTEPEANNYDTKCGTSGSAPIVTGLVGIMQSIHPMMGQEEARFLIRAGAEDQVGDTQGEDQMGCDDYYGCGRLNMHRTLQATLSAASFAVHKDPVNRDTIVVEYLVANPIAASYDFIRGDVANMRRDDTLPGTDLGEVTCIENESMDARTEDPTIPNEYQAFFYLARFNPVVVLGRNAMSVKWIKVQENPDVWEPRGAYGGTSMKVFEDRVVGSGDCHHPSAWGNPEGP